MDVAQKDEAARAMPDDDLDLMGERRPSRIITRDFQPRNFMTTMRVITAMNEDQQAAQHAYDEGMSLFEQATHLHESGQGDSAGRSSTGGQSIP